MKRTKHPMPEANRTAFLVCMIFWTAFLVSSVAYGVYRNGADFRLFLLLASTLPGTVCVWAIHFGWQRKRKPAKGETFLYLNTLTAGEQEKEPRIRVWP